MLDKLPSEVLVTIFSNLNYQDRKAVRQVCSNCRFAGYFSCLIKDEILRLDGRLKRHTGESTLESIKSCNRNFYHLEVNDIDHIDRYFYVVQQFGPNLNSLIINNSILLFHDILHLLVHLPKLEHMKLEGCPLYIERTTIEPRINNKLRIKKFEVINTNYLTDELLFKFWRLFPDLEHLTLNNVNINCHAGVYAFNYSNNPNNLLLNPSGHVLTMQFLLKIIETRPRFLKSISFADTRVTNDLTWSLLQNEFIELETLNLNNCRELRPTPNADLLGIWQSSLKDLQLSACEWASSDSLARICLSVQCLKILNISHNKVLTDTCLQNLTILRHLEEIDISFCNEFTSEGIRRVFTRPELTKTLRVFKLNGTKITDEDLASILQEVSLYELHVSYCSFLGDGFLNNLFQNQKYLKKLATANIRLSDIGLNGYCGNIDFQLPYFNFFKYKRTGLLNPMKRTELIKDADDFLDLINIISFKYRPNLSNLVNLQHLNLNRCPGLTDVAFGYPLQFPNLKEFSVRGMKTITSFTAILISYYFPNLEKVDFTDTKIDDIGVCILILKLKKLKFLSLGNTPITDQSLQIIIECAKQLRSLNVQSCYDLNLVLLTNIRNLPCVIEVVGTIRSRYSLQDTSPPPTPPSFS